MHDDGARRLTDNKSRYARDAAVIDTALEVERDPFLSLTLHVLSGAKLPGGWGARARVGRLPQALRRWASGTRKYLLACTVLPK